MVADFIIISANVIRLGDVAFNLRGLRTGKSHDRLACVMCSSFLQFFILIEGNQKNEV